VTEHHAAVVGKTSPAAFYFPFARTPPPLFTINDIATFRSNALYNVLMTTRSFIKSGGGMNGDYGK
jgi:hypothetical protein